MKVRNGVMFLAGILYIAIGIFDGPMTRLGMVEICFGIYVIAHEVQRYYRHA